MSKLYIIVVLLISVALLLSNASSPPAGHTGAPGESTCQSCHVPPSSGQDGSITVTGMPATIEPNMAYVLTVTNSNPNGLAALAGFQVTILDNSNNKAGNISGASAGSTIILSAGRQYWEHSPCQPYPANNMVMWTATWTASNIPANALVTYYVAGNVANGNGNSGGDLIVTSTGSGMMNGGSTPLMVSITSSTDVVCNGQSTGSATALATGGVMPYAYHWSNGANGATINNLAAGTYTVTVTDNVASTATASVVIMQPPALAFTNPTITNVSCNGGNNGSITAHPSGGVPPYFLNWSTGATGATITNLTAGAYTVTVTDDNNCTKTATYQVTQPALIVINLVNLTNESCSGANDGAITISTSGGVSPIFAEWSNGSIGTTITGLAPDMYSVTVTDNNNCTKTATFTINPGGVVTVTLNQIQNVTCNGGSNGSISVSGSGGISPYTYNWSNGHSGPVNSGLTAGSYIVTVTDSHGCSTVKGYTVTQPPAIVVQIMQPTQNMCFGDSTADLTSTVSGGVSPYTELWSNGVVGLNNSNLHAGTYTITATDANGCTATKSATITDPPQLTALISTTNETAVGANNGTAMASPAGGSPGYTYLWSNGATTSSITGLPPGSYCVTITDMHGCTVSGCGQVNAFGCMLHVMLGQDLTICEGATTIILPSVSGASGNVTYIWTDGSTADSLLVNQGGEYCVTVTDQSGCQSSDCIVITQIIIPPLECPVINESSPGAHDGAVQCDGISGIVSFVWSNGATTPSITGLSPGVFCVTVTDANGCTKSQCFIVQPGNCQLSITSAQTDVACAGDSTGQIVIAANNVTAPVVYTWSNGESTSTISNLAAGNYAVTVSDATGCIATGSFIIAQPEPLSITVDSIFPVEDFPTGLIWITVNGGTPPDSYLWHDPDGNIFVTEDLDGLQLSGNYQLKVTDQNGCTVLSAQIFLASDVAVGSTPNFKSLNVYPVPASDVLIVDIENPITEVLISGIDGRQYKRIVNPGSNKLDVSDLQSGWYMIRISDGHTWYIARMVK